jgi:hypothetical protein
MVLNHRNIYIDDVEIINELEFSLRIGRQILFYYMVNNK